MSKKSYFTIVLPLRDAAQAMARQRAGQYQLRAMLWSLTAERMKALLGKTCSMFAPAVLPVYCSEPVPFGVALGAVEPHEFLTRYYSAKQAQEDAIRARCKRIEAMGDPVFTKQISERIELAVVAVDMSEPALQSEAEFAGRFFQGDITAACGLYYLGPGRCYVEEDVEKHILAHLNEYAVCVAELEE